MATVELIRVCKSYGDRMVVHPLELSLDAGQTYVLIGPSGCGKSTLLKMVIGLVAPDRGHVRVLGEDLTSENVRAVRQRIGYVIQDGGLFPHLSVSDNVTLVAKYLAWPPTQIQDRLDELIALTQLPGDALARYPAQLSGGQQQRVGLMRALMLDPELLLLDEPLGSLDPIVRFELQEDLRRVFQSLEKTVIMVTHDLAEAAFFADDILLLAEGQLVQRGSIDQLVETPADPFVTRFVRAQRTAIAGGEA